MNYLPLNVFGEQIIIDYHKRELVFPNRNDEDLDDEFSSRICAYLNEEGFLNFGSKRMGVHKSNSPPVHLGTEKGILDIGEKLPLSLPTPDIWPKTGHWWVFIGDPHRIVNSGFGILTSKAWVNWKPRVRRWKEGVKDGPYMKEKHSRAS